jgi:hypothetical protein
MNYILSDTLEYDYFSFKRPDDGHSVCKINNTILETDYLLINVRSQGTIQEMRDFKDLDITAVISLLKLT